LEEINLHLQAADFLVERRGQRLRIRHAPRTPALEAMRSVLKQLLLPLRYLCRMHLVSRRQLAQRVHPLNRLQRHLRLELLGMILALLSHFSNSFRTLSGVLIRRVKPTNLYLAPVQKMGVTSHALREMGNSPFD